MHTLRNEIFAYAKEKYSTEPEYLWSSTPDGAVLRHDNNRKWYAVFLHVRRDRLGLSGEGIVDVIGVKCEPLMIGSLLQNDGYLPAYHMNKDKWISILLDGTVDYGEICQMLDISFALTATKHKRS